MSGALPPCGRASLGALLTEHLGTPAIRREDAGDHVPTIAALTPTQVEQLRLAGSELRAAERFAYHALHHGCSEAIAEARACADRGAHLLALAERPA